MAHIPWLDTHAPFPPLTAARPDGLLAAGADLSPNRLLDAYQRGIFPWYSDPQPLLWWSPSPRCVLYPERFHASRSLKKRARANPYRITCNQAFAGVMHACATANDRQHGTWITQTMLDAYATMHQLGWAHSVEVWRNQTLVGGVYGLALGEVFFGESMFSHETDASKLALMALCRALVQLGFPLLDCQVENAHLLSLGAECIPREHFQATLQQHARTVALSPDTLQHAILLATRSMAQEAS